MLATQDVHRGDVRMCSCAFPRRSAQSLRPAVVDAHRAVLAVKRGPVALQRLTALVRLAGPPVLVGAPNLLRRLAPAHVGLEELVRHRWARLHCHVGGGWHRAQPQHAGRRRPPRVTWSATEIGFASDRVTSRATHRGFAVYGFGAYWRTAHRRHSTIGMRRILQRPSAVLVGREAALRRTPRGVHRRARDAAPPRPVPPSAVTAGIGVSRRAATRARSRSSAAR